MNWERILVMMGLGILSCGCQIQFTPRLQPFYQEVLQQHPDNAAALYLQGRVNINAGQYRPARDDFRRYTQAAPQDARGWTALGQCELELGAFVAAERAFHQAMAVKEDVAAATGLAEAVVMQGRLAEAGELLKQAQARYGETAGLWRAQGDAALMAGQAPEALQAYEKSLVQNPTQPDLRDRVRDLRDYLTNRP